MTSHGKGTFQVTGWDEKPYDQTNGQKLTKTHVTETFSGEIQGDSAVDYLMAYPDERYAAIVGMQRVTGGVGGKQGSFLLQATGKFENGTATCDLSVVPGSGTDELTGLTGEGSFRTDDTGSASYEFHYAIK